MTPRSARGLVVGDDQDQPPAMVERFRASGLAHLTAVSGQNVAFVLAAAGPLLRRSRPLSRWMLTLGLIGWFVLLTRAEPSVMRAGTMAALSATAFLLGRQREPVRLLALAVAGLLLLDPLLAWSVGFWLSVGATAGVTAIGPWLAPRLGALGPLALPVAVTVGAQLGVALPSLLVFGRLSLVGTVANLVAVPVAGLVMLYGLPACLAGRRCADRCSRRDGARRRRGPLDRRRGDNRLGRRAWTAVVMARLGGGRRRRHGPHPGGRSPAFTGQRTPSSRIVTMKLCSTAHAAVGLFPEWLLSAAEVTTEFAQ